MPAERAILAPPPGRSSMQWIVVPTGMLRSGRLLPGLMSAPGRPRPRSPWRRPCGRDDVALLAVGVVQQRDPRRAVRVVLDVRDLGRHAVLVVATEVDDAVGALVTAALVPGGDPALVVAAALLGQRAHQRLLRRRPRDLDEVGDRRAATARGGRLVLADSHEFSVLVCLGGRSGDRTPEDVDALALGEADDRALGVCALARPEAGAAGLALAVDVLTVVTLTSKTFSTAILISVLLASGRTRNVYLFASSRP